MSYPYQYYAVVIPGLEAMAADELAVLSAHEIRVDACGVHFAGTLETLYRVNLRARLITRVLLRLGSFKAMSWPELFNKSKKLAWANHLVPESVVAVQASCHRSRLMHSGRAAGVVRDAIMSGVGCRGADGDEAPTQTVHVRFDEDRCTISLDTSGERLDRRGYRLYPGPAPVRETLAAGVLAWLDWQPDQPLLVPMCGSGTLAIEAALQARRIAPGLSHGFPFTQWPVCKAKGWQRAREKAAQLKGFDGALQIAASDIEAAAVQATIDNADRAEVGDALIIEQQDLFTLMPESASGVMICNPPFGIRIGSDTHALYRRLGTHLGEHFRGWRIAVFCPDRHSEAALGLIPADTLHIRHGGRWMNILRLEP